MDESPCHTLHLKELLNHGNPCHEVPSTQLFVLMLMTEQVRNSAVTELAGFGDFCALRVAALYVV